MSALNLKIDGLDNPVAGGDKAAMSPAPKSIPSLFSEFRRLTLKNTA